MPRTHLALGLFLLAATALIIAGCSSSDDYNPTTAVDTSSLPLQSDQAQQFSLSALDMVNELVATVPDFATADFAQWNLAKSPSDSVQWDPAQQAYTFDFEGPVFVMEPPSSWIMTVGIRLQYRNALGEPLQFPVGAVEMEVDYNTGMDMYLVEGDDISELEYDMATNLVVSYLGQGQTYGILGTGDTNVAVSQTTAQGSRDGSFTMDWALDITSSADGCPAGTAAVNLQDFRLDAVYDGQGNAAWTLSGPGYQASGTDTMPCQAAGN